MSAAATAVRRPLGTWMLVIAICVLGLISLTRLPLALLPDINFPIAVVLTDYPNAGPDEVETQVSRPIEEALSTVGGLRRVSSQSASGSSTVVAEFEWGIDMNFASLEMRERVDAVVPFLPDGVDTPRIFKFDPSSQPIFQFAVGGFDDLAALRRAVDTDLRPRLERIAGVAAVNLTGGLEREIEISVDPARLDSWGLSLQQVRQALAAGSLTLPAGSLREGRRRLLLRTVGEFESVDEIARTVVSAEPPAGVVRVEDVALVRDGFKEQEQISRLNGKPSVTVSIQRESNANTVRVSDAVRAELERIEAELGETFTLDVVWDEADFIRSAIRSVIENALVGAVCAMLVLFLFLRALRPTLIVVASIPVAGIATFFFLYLTDVSLNILSLGGLALGLGMLVDNSIVSLENIVRRRQLGEETVVAAVEGADEVGGALWASTLTTVAVFLPIVFVGGIAAELFNDLALAVTASLLISLLVARTFVPMIAGQVGLAPPSAKRPAGRLARWQTGYAGALRSVLRRRGLFLAAVFAVFVAILVFGTDVGLEFLPATDTGEIAVNVRLPYGSTREATNEVVARIEAFAAALPEVERVAASVGGAGGFGASGEERGQVRIILRPPEERAVSTADVIERLRDFVRDIPGARITMAMADVLAGGVGGDAPVVINLLGRDLDALNAAAEEVAARLERVAGTRDVTIGTSEGRPELQVVVDRDRAGQLGLTVAQVAQGLRDAVQGVTVTRFRTGVEGQEVDVVLRLDERWRDDRAVLENLLLESPFGAVPLREVGRIEDGLSPITIARRDQQRVVTVTARLAPGVPLSQVVGGLAASLAATPLPRGVSVDFGGDNELMQDAFRELGIALVLAVAITYMILVAQFESLVQPFLIMASVPLGMVGALLAVTVTGSTLSVPGLVGMIMLAGIVVNNGIVMIDYINRLRRDGRARLDAVVTGAHTRLRPILMTTGTTVLGMFPLSLGLGEGSELQQPIAIVVIGGLVFSTLITLFLTPVLYTVADDWAAWVRRLLRGPAARGGETRPGEEGPSGASALRAPDPGARGETT